MIEFRLDPYQDRKIEFVRSYPTGDWQTKVYTITKNEKFNSAEILKQAIDALPIWTSEAEKSQLQTYQLATLIVHEAREGAWLLFSWWTDGEMIESRVRFANYGSPVKIIDSPHSESLLCVWELEVYMHERKAWIEHVLMQSAKPDFAAYLNDSL